MPMIGRKGSFESKVRSELPVLYRVARRLCGCPTEAEDLVGQTLMKACRGWDGFDGRFLRSWLIQILRREFYDRRRQANAAPLVLDLEEIDLVDDGDWSAVDWKLAAERILDELDRLPEEYRLAVQLCDVEEMSYEEAAEAMEVPIGTVRSRLYRGRAQLRQRLSAFVAEEEVS
jgi:RNA polymerase sigma-70 factor, ECF subfamily